MPTASTAATHSVLIVEDNPTNRRVIEALLSKQGIQFTSVQNGEEAVSLITQGLLPALVLMDCQMPVMDGYEATQAIRKWEKDNDKPRLPIIALTASVFEEDRNHCIAVGMDDFLTKPVDITRLTSALSKWIA